MQAQPYLNNEDRVINDALEWLSANQAVNGSFPEVGKVSHTDMQGGSAKGIPLTAYVLLAFLENKVRRSLQRKKKQLKPVLPSKLGVYLEGDWIMSIFKEWIGQCLR